MSRRVSACVLIFAAGALAGAAALAWAVAPPKMSANVLLNIMTDELR